MTIDVLAARKAAADGTLSESDRATIGRILPGLLEELQRLPIPGIVEDGKIKPQGRGR